MTDKDQASVGKAYNAHVSGACPHCHGAGSVYDPDATNDRGGRGVRSKCDQCVGGWTHAWHAARDARRNADGHVVTVWPAHAAGPQ